jgi:phage gp37-like protein
MGNQLRPMQNLQHDRATTLFKGTMRPMLLCGLRRSQPEEAKGHKTPLVSAQHAAGVSKGDQGTKALCRTQRNGIEARQLRVYKMRLDTAACGSSQGQERQTETTRAEKQHARKLGNTLPILSLEGTPTGNLQTENQKGLITFRMTRKEG